MIGVAGENGAGAIKLFEQHDAHQLVRPGGRPKGELELGLGFQGRTLLGARGVKLLIVLLEHVEIGFCRRARGWDDRWRRDLWPRHLWRRDLGSWSLRRGILGERGEVGAERQYERQSRAEHEARIGAARPSKNHRVQR